MRSVLTTAERFFCSNSSVASRSRCCRSPQVISSTKDTAGLRKNISAFSWDEADPRHGGIALARAGAWITAGVFWSAAGCYAFVDGPVSRRQRDENEVGENQVPADASFGEP